MKNSIKKLVNTSIEDMEQSHKELTALNEFIFPILDLDSLQEVHKIISYKIELSKRELKQLEEFICSKTDITF